MEPEQFLKTLFGVSFEEQSDLTALRQFFAPNAFCCNKAREVIGICATKLDVGELSLPALPDLQYLNLGNNEQLKKLEFQAALPALEHLDVSDSGLEGELKFPAGFDRLRWLDASRNKLKTFILVGQLAQLRHLDLSDNQLNEFSAHLLVRFPKLVQFFLKGNPLTSAKRQAADVSGSSLSFMQRFLQELGNGETENKEFKVLLVGNGGVGKSCLVERLVYETFEQRHLSTHGVVLEQYPREQPSDFPFILNLWDFGGQDIYHATHRLFMQVNAVYLALWDEETRQNPESPIQEDGEERQYENFSLGYWLHYIRHQGGNSPVIVVKTKSQADNSRHPDEYALDQRYKPMDFLQIDSFISDKRNNGCNKLLFTVKEAIEQRLGIEKQLPLTWANLRQHLRDLLRSGTKALPLDEYFDIAGDYHIEHPMDVLKWLAQTGVVFYREGYFGNAVMLDQSWAIEAVYAVFNRNNKLQYHYLRDTLKGRFSGANLQEIWSKKQPSPAEQELFISFMISCELCFEVTEQKEEDKYRQVPLAERQFIAPQLLPKDEPSIVEVVQGLSKMLYIQYRHDFLHQGTMQRFIVRAQSLADTKDIWQHGIVVKESGHYAMVTVQRATHRGRHAYDINILCDKHNLGLMDKIRNTIEELQGEAVQEWVSLNGQDYVNMSKLKNWQQDRIPAENDTLVAVEDLKIFLGRRDQGKLELPKEAHQAQTERLIQKLGVEKLGAEQSLSIPIPPLEFGQEKVTLLFLQANPTEKLISWEIESESIRSSLKDSVQGEFCIEICEQASLSDMHDAIERHEPSILHFCGHGQEEGDMDPEGIIKQPAGLVLHSNGKNGKEVLSSEQLEVLFRNFKEDLPQLKLVFLNACHSREQAVAISKVGIFTIGTTKEIFSETARIFAAGVYRNLVKNKSLEQSIRRGISRANLSDKDIPKLIEAYYNGQRIYPQ
ncbi:MAG: COR domain-containing protein [Saprospiraceae bacterium]|nr:COR domain-containing protein [Saprospiraceae bacterium]